MRGLICALVAVVSLPVLAWAGDAEPMPGPASSETLPLPGMLPAMLPAMEPTMATMSPNSWAGFYVNESGGLAISSGAPSLFDGLLGPGGIRAGQAIGGMSSGAVGVNWQTGDTII